MRWGVIRIIIFMCAFLVGLLMFDSGRPSVGLVISAAPSERPASEGTCGGSGNLVLTQFQGPAATFTME